MFSKSKAAARFQITLGLGSHLYYLCIIDIMAFFFSFPVKYYSMHLRTSRFGRNPLTFHLHFSSVANGDNVIFANP